MIENNEKSTIFVNVGHVSAVEEKSTALVFETNDQNRRTGFVIKFNGEFYAYLNACPHTGSELDWDIGEFFNADGESLICATHGAIFDPASGICTSGPCVNQRLISLPLKLEGDEIFVRVDRSL